MTQRQIPTQAQVDAAWQRWCAQSDLPVPYRVWLHGEDHTDTRYTEWVVGLERRRAEPARPDDLTRLTTKALRYVDPTDLICEGCGEHTTDTPTGQFTHADGTPLCPGRNSQPTQPVEQ